MSRTMSASVLESPGVIATRDVPIPKLDGDQVLVRIAAVGVCGSDVHYFTEGRIGDFVVERPLILGHEAAGTIVEVGRNVPAERIGERVAIEPQRCCRVCEQCKLGRYNLCASIEFYATPPIDGAFAQFQAIQTDFAHPIPDGMSFDAAALCEPLSVGICSVRKAGLTAGSRVLITGAGPVGIVTAQAARAAGVTEIIVADVAQERRELASRHGATRVVDPRSPGIFDNLEVDAFIDASGAGSAIRSGIHAVKPAGRVVLVGMGADSIELPVSRVQRRELLVTGVFRYANTWPLAIELVSSGRVDLDSLVTGRFPLDDVAGALKAATDPGGIKAVVYPPPLP